MTVLLFVHIQKKKVVYNKVETSHGTKEEIYNLGVNFTLSKNLGENKIPPYFCTLFVLIDKKGLLEEFIIADPTSMASLSDDIKVLERIMLFYML
jgi:hypothetical protein